MTSKLNFPRWFLSVFIAAVVSPSVIACEQSRFEKDLDKINQQKDKSLTAATEPIYRRYRQDLEILLRRATQANDLDSALKIKECLELIPSEPESPKDIPKTAEELAIFLEGTTWEISDKKPKGKTLYTITFTNGNTFKHSDGRVGKVTFTGARAFKLWDYDPATLNQDLTEFSAVGSAYGNTIPYFGKIKK